MMRTKLAFAAGVLALSLGAAWAGQVTVPLVGCASDGQVGPDRAPQGSTENVDLPPAIAARLAFYKSQYDNGVLGPRGWHCANLEGSNGWITIVAPEPLNPTDLLNPKTHPLKGPAIQLTQCEGGTSGRFEVAQLVMRYFPARRAFARRVIAEGIEPASHFPSGPFKTDKLITRRKDVVEYVTPPGQEGLGTKSRLVPSDLPIHSVALVTGAPEEPQGFIFSLRLPKSMEDLAPIIIREAERQYAPEN